MSAFISNETIEDETHEVPKEIVEEQARLRQKPTLIEDTKPKPTVESEQERRKKLRSALEADQNVESMYTDSETWGGQWTSERQKLADLEPDPVVAKAAMANLRWIAHMEGKSIEEIAPYLPIYTEAYSEKYFEGKAKTQKEFYTAVQIKYQVRSKQKDALNDLYGELANQTLTDTLYGVNSSFALTVGKWTSQHGDLFDEEHEAEFLKRAFAFGYQFRHGLERLKQPAAKGLDVLTRFTEGKASDDDVLQLASDFTQLSAEDRDDVLMIMGAAAKARLISRERLEQFRKNIGESISRSFDFIGKGSLASMEDSARLWLNQLKQNNVHMGSSGNPRFGPAMRPGSRELTDEEKVALEEKYQRQLKSYQIVRQLRDFAKRVVDPVIPVFAEGTFLGTMEQGLNGLAGSTGFLVASAIPYTFGMVGLKAYRDENYDRILLENPDIDPTVAGQLALLEAGANVALDRMQLRRLPVLGQLFRKVKTNGWRNTAVGAGKVWTEQNVQELAQNGVAPVVETIAASMRPDMVKKDAGEEFRKYVADIPVTLASTFWLAAIGGGFASIADIKNPGLDLDLALDLWGFSKEQADRIRASKTAEEFDAAVREEMPRRSEENIKTGRQKAEEMYQAAEQASGVPNAPRLDSRTVNGTTAWIVTDADGKEVLRNKDFEVAAMAYDELKDARNLNESSLENPTQDSGIEANDAPYGISKEGSQVIKYNATARTEWESAQVTESNGQEIFGVSDFPSGGKLKDIIARVKEWGQSHGLFKKHPTPALNAEVEIRPRAISNDLSHGASDDKIKSVASLPKLLANAVHIQTEESQNRPGLKTHILAAKLSFANDDHIVSIVVRESEGHLFYDHEFVEKAKGEPTDKPRPGVTTRRDLPEGSPSTGSVVRSALGVNSDRQSESNTNPQSQTTSNPNERGLSLSEKGEQNPSTVPDHDGKLLAPNGKPSNLSTEQWHLVRTPEFKQWFGDWESLAEIRAMEERVTEWLSPENLTEAKGKTREQIFAMFGNQPVPIAFLPEQYLQFFDGATGDNRVYSGKGYFLDHAVNHHPEIGAAEYGSLQEILSSADEVIIDRRIDHNTGKSRDVLMFVKNIGKNYILAVALGENESGKIVFHKSLYANRGKKKPYPSLPRVGIATSGGGVSPIGSAAEAAPGGSLSARDVASVKVPQFIRKVNPETVNKAVDENGEPRIFERSQHLDQSTTNPENTNDSDSPENLKSSESVSGRPNERPSWLTSEFEARINSDGEAPRITRPEAEAALRDIEAAGGGETGSFQFVNWGELRARQSAGMDAAERLAAIFGRRVVVFRNGEKPWINGITNTLHPDKIFINADSGRPYWSVAGHELWHHLQMERPELADQTWNALRDGLQNFDKYEQMRRTDGYSEREIPNELLGDALADAMADPGFWSRLSQRNPSLFDKFTQAVKAWLDRVVQVLRRKGFGAESFFKDFEAAKDVLAEALARFGTKDSNNKLGPYLPDDPNQNHYAGGHNPSPQGLPKAGQSFNSEKKKIPKAAGKILSNLARMPQGDWVKSVTNWLSQTETVIDPDGERVILQNPEKGSLQNRALHLIASYEGSDTYKNGERKLSSEKARTVFYIQTTIEDYQVKAIDERGQLAYFRQYEDGTLHMVIVEKATGKLQDHRLITQRPLDRKTGAKGFIVQKSRLPSMLNTPSSSLTTPDIIH